MLLVLLAFLYLCVLSQDPADSWLAYFVARGGGGRVTRVNATWTVMAYPTIMSGGNAPGWWFGIEDVPALNLIQPILAYGYTGEEYAIFNGYYDWNTGNFWASDTGTVSPGQIITSSVWYDAPSDSYNMYIGCNATGFSVTSNIPANGLLYTDTYFVVEHEPNSCGEYPANGNVTFQNVYIEIDGKPIRPKWQAIDYQDACNCQPQIINPSTLLFTWETS